MRFVDTNVLLYAISKAPDERDKAHVALELLRSPDLALSVQVLEEFYVQATRAGKPGALTHPQAAALVDSFLRFRVQEKTVALVAAALRTRERFGISYWDAAILEAARALGCRTVLSEDLTDGRDYGGVAVEDPFRAAERLRSG
jgi:predicted nucleic acid-binding protein